MTDTLKRWVAERRRIAEAATPGPWVHDQPPAYGKKCANVVETKDGATMVAECYDGGDETEMKNAKAIADARNSFSTLIDIVEMQDTILDDAEETIHGEYCGKVCHGVHVRLKEARAAVEALLKEKT